MMNSKIALIGLLSSLFVLTTGSKCPQESITRSVICYYKNERPLTNLNICNCTHVIFTNAVKKSENFTLDISEETKQDLLFIKENKKDLIKIFTFETKPEDSTAILKSENKTIRLIREISKFLRVTLFDGVELNFNFNSQDGASKDSYSSFIKDLTKVLSSNHQRVKRDGYDVFEKVQDDVTTVAYSTQSPRNSTNKTQSIKQIKVVATTKSSNRKTRDDRDTVTEESDRTDATTLEDIENEEVKSNLKPANDQSDVEGKRFYVFVRLSIQPEVIAKKFDLKTISRYADVLTVPTHDIFNKNEEHQTYHPSRLMGLSDIFNTDSILDFLTGMGALKSKIVISIPATVLEFKLEDASKNTPRSPSSEPKVVDQSQLCLLLSKSNWTLERDEDLTAPYAFSGKTWLSFEDEISVNIKSKYILLRELAGGAIYPLDADVSDKSCPNRSETGGHLAGVLYKNFKSLERKPRALVLESLQEEIHDTSFAGIEAGVKLSEYRIVRVVDHSGAVHVIRKNTKTQFECTRQGYFSHPLGCNKFYRCVKFDQYSDEYTVFEYDCPAGLAFDERWEVCVWPGSLPHGAPCTGSSEIAPVPRSHYQCPNQEGYYADPENCRWFFACLDHARDGITPLTAYEFRCPFGLVFNEHKLACDWPWLVGACGSRGASGYVVAGGSSSGIRTFVNGGNLETSFGQYGNVEEEASFNSFGRGFGSVLKAAGGRAQSSYQGAQTAGFGYIASRYDDNQNRASFGTLPDYEISGGRILNKGGVVLDQVVGVGSGIGSNAAKGYFEGGNYGQQNVYLESGQGGDFRANTAFGNAQSIELQKLDSVSLLPKATIIQGSDGLTKTGEASFQHSISTPKPFVVNIPSIQGKSYEYSQQTFSKSSTPQNLGSLGLLQKDNSNTQASGSGYYSGGDQQYTVQQGFSVTKAPIAGQSVISEGISFSTPATPVAVPVITSKVETSGFGQSTFKGSGISTGINVNQPSVSFGASSSNQILQNTGGSVETVSVGYHSAAVPVTPGYEYTSSGYTGGQSVSQPSVSLGTASIDLAKQTGTVSSGKAFVGPSTISVEIPRVTPTTPVHVFEGSNSGQGLLTENVATHQSSVLFESSTPRSPLYSVSGGGISKESANIGFGVSTASPKVTIQSFKGSSVSRGFGYTPRPTVSYQVPDVTPKTTFYTSDQSEFGLNGGSGSIGISQQVVSNSFPSVTPKFSETTIGSSSLLEESAFGSKSTPSYKYHGIQSEGLSVNTPSVSVKFPTVTAKPIELTTASGQSGQGFEGFSGGSYELPVVTPKAEIYNIGEKSSLQSTVQPQITYNVQSSKPGSQLGQVVASQDYFKTKSQSYQDYSGPSQPTFGQQFSYSSSFKQSGGRLSSPRPFSFETVSQTPKSAIFDQSGLVLSSGDKSKLSTQVTIEHQPIVSVGTVSTYEPEQSTPKTLFSQYLPPSGTTYEKIKFKSSVTQARPHISVSTPAPVVSVTSSTPALYEQSTPQSFDFDKTFQQQSVSLQPISSISTPSPVTQETFSKVTPFDRKLVKSTFFSQPTLQKGFTQTVDVTPRPFGYQQSVSTVTPAPVVPQQNNFYVTPVTRKIEVFKPKIQQTVHVTPSVTTYTKTFGNINQGQQIELQQEPLQPVVNQNFEFFKTKPAIYNSQQTVEDIQYQVPIQGSTFGPDYKEPVTLRPIGTATVRPCDNKQEFLEISKSVELNPNNVFQSGGQVVSFQQSTTKPIVVQQQPFHLISQNKFKNNQIIQPFYKQSSSFNEDGEIYQTQANPIQGIGQEVHSFQQQVTVQTPKTTYYEEKQYLPPAVTPKAFVTTAGPSTVKSTIAESSGYYSENRNENVTPLLPVIDTSLASDITVSGQKEKLLTRVQGSGYLPPVQTKKPTKTVYSEQYERFRPQVSVSQQEIVSPKVNLLLPVTTEAPQQYYSPLTEDVTIQQHSNFEFQKVNKVKGIGSPSQNVFIQPETYTTVRPVVSTFDASRQFRFGETQNFTFGGGYQSGVKYPINPKIEIPQPPKEYLLSQGVYSTEQPQYSTENPIQYNIGNQISSTTTASSLEEFKGPEYLPPKGSYPADSSRRKSSKATIISAGSVDEHELRDDNIQQLLEKYSGQFGQVLNEGNDKFVTKVVKGDGKGRLDFGRQPSSTIRYEVSSSRSRQRGRGRQYHGSITSNLQATNKYEEYEIEGDKEGQRSIDLGNRDNSNQDGSKTTLDLKNLKLDKNKKTVIVVSQVSDANPILIGKLAGQCSCQSNKLELRNKGRKPSSLKYETENSQNYPELQPLQPQSTISKEYLPEYKGNQGDNVAVEAITHDGLLGTVEVTPETVLIGGRQSSSTQGVNFEVGGQNDVSSTTVAYSEDNSPSILSSLGPDGVLPITPKTLFSDDKIRNKKKQFRGRTRYLPPASTFGDKYSGDGSLVPLLSPVPASEIASTVDYAVLKGDESRTQNEIEGGAPIGKAKTYAGAAFDRYGPGGWRSYDETLQGSVDCKRPGLFRHPKYCNKFYACNYDPWKERYTLHVFNCPIHLTYDSSISACNWPIRGPACADDNLLV